MPNSDEFAEALLWLISMKLNLGGPALAAEPIRPAAPVSGTSASCPVRRRLLPKWDRKSENLRRSHRLNSARSMQLRQAKLGKGE
jgi:hypothetical protein